MYMKNMIKYSLVALMVACGFAACSEDDGYEAATISGAQVFFASGLSSQYEIKIDQTSFSVPISRYESAEAATVPLTVKMNESSIFTVPSSISFEAGSKTANLVVSYDTAKIEYGKYDTISVAIDPAFTTPYAAAEYTFTAGVTAWGPWKNWNAAGTCTYTYANYYGGDDPGLPFQYRQNTIYPNLMQFAISGWAKAGDGGITLVLDYDKTTGHVTCAPVQAATHSSYGPVYVADSWYYWVTVRGTDISKMSEDDYGKFDEENGYIRIPMAWYVSAGTFGYSVETVTIDGYDRADLSSSVKFAGIYTDAEGKAFAVGNLEWGADVTNAQAVVVSADEDAKEVADNIANGTLESVTLEAAGNVNVPIPDGMTGKLQIVVAVLNGAEVASFSSAAFEYWGGGANPWKSLGIGLLTDNFVITMYGPDEETAYDPLTYEVEIEENTETPGLYRIVNAYQKVAEVAECDYSSANIEIDATDPDGVFILPQETGIDDGGMVSIASYGGYLLSQYDAATLKGYGLLGTLKDGVITLPAIDSQDKSYTYQGLFFLGSSGYYTGTSGAFKLVLPSAVEASRMPFSSNWAAKANHKMPAKKKLTFVNRI
jgi:hypothetical protein